MFYIRIRRAAARISGILAALVLIAVASSTAAHAQESEKVNRINVVDGKVYVNGEMVAELDNAELPVFFKSGEISDKDMAYYSRSNAGGVFVLDDGGKVEFSGEDGEHKFGKMRFFSSDNKGEGHAFGFTRKVGDGDFTAYNVRGDRHWNPFMSSEHNVLYDSESSEIRELELKSLEQARRIRAASDDDRENLEQELRDTLNMIFDLKLDATRERLNRMTAEFQELEARVTDRNASKEDIVSRRFSELVGERDALSW